MRTIFGQTAEAVFGHSTAPEDAGRSPPLHLPAVTAPEGVSGGSWEPGQERGEVERAGAVAGVFVRAGGQPAPLFDLAEAAFDDIAVGVAGGVEADRVPAGGALAAPVGLLVARSGDGVGDTAAAQ
jgi:hypothetical protein